ncbi:MAG TPA: sodium:solute symporter [Vicinamibacteria bacterium]|nr:sodium:solute symporter [Vicinamibacteria bacterium]
MSTLDWAVLAVYLVGIVGFGLWAGRGNRRIDDFFLAGREMRWWAVGLSVMATQISAITFIGTTGQAYTDGMRFLVVYFGLPFAMVILCATLVPFFYQARVFTAYEYLERRFDARTRTLTSLLFLLSRGLSVGVTLYAPSLVLSVLLGWGEAPTVLLMGLSTIVYVMYGGNRSVIWTDVVQMAIIWAGILLCFGVAIRQLPDDVGLRDALALAQAGDKLRVMDGSPSLTQPYTLWSGLVGGLFLMLSYFGCDQSQVQRYLSGKSLTQSRLSLLFNAFLKVPMQFLILLTGVLVFVFYHFHAPPILWNRVELHRLEREAPRELAAAREGFERAYAARRVAADEYVATRSAEAAERYRERGRELEAARRVAVDIADRTTTREARSPLADRLARILGIKAPTYNDTNYIFPTYVLTQLPRGLAGLVIAVIFAAAMSTLSGEFNSLATATMVDFYKRYVRPSGGDAHELLVSRLLTAFWGGFACLVALQAGRLGTAIEVVNRFGSYFYGSILGVFALAVLTPRAGPRGAFYGLVVGMSTVALVAWTTSIHFLWYNLIGTLAVLVSGLAITALSGEAPAAAPQGTQRS